MTIVRQFTGTAEDVNQHLRVSMYQDLRTMDTRVDICRWDMNTRKKYLAKFVNSQIEWVEVKEGDVYPSECGFAIDRFIVDVFVKALLNATDSSGLKPDRVNGLELAMCKTEGLLAAKEDHLQDMRHMLELPSKIPFIKV